MDSCADRMGMAKHGRNLVRAASSRTAAWATSDRSPRRGAREGAGRVGVSTEGRPWWLGVGSVDEQPVAKHARRKTSQRKKNRVGSWLEDRRPKGERSPEVHCLRGWRKPLEASMSGRLRNMRDENVAGKEKPGGFKARMARPKARDLQKSGLKRME